MPSGGFPFVDFSNLNLNTIPMQPQQHQQQVPNFSNQMNTLNFNAQITPSQTQNNTQMNFFENLSQPNVSNLSNVSNQESVMKQIFSNNEITVNVSLIKSPDNTNIHANFYISNNIEKLLNNVKFNLSVKKYLICKVLSTSGMTLEPKRSLGIKKVKFMLIFRKFL